MADEITSERLGLRRVRVDDAALIVPFCTDPRIYRNLARMKPDQTLDETRTFLASAEKNPDAHVYTVWRDQEFLGLCGIETGPSGLSEIGYWYGSHAWGQGYATEAAEALIAYLRQEIGLKALHSGHFHDNPGSGAVLRKLGFLPAGWSYRHSVGRGETVLHRDVGWVA